MVRSQDGEVFQSTLYKGQPMGQPLKKKREEIIKRFLLQGNYVMFDYFHTRVYPFENCESFSPISILPSSPIPPPLLNGKRAAAEIDPRPAVWIGNFEEELHKLNFFWGFQWYTWPSLKVDFDSDSIEFEDILSCTGVCVKQSPLGQDLEFQKVTPTGKLDWFRVKLSLLVWISQIPGFSSDLLTQPPPPTVPLSDDCSGESSNFGFTLTLQIKVEQCHNQWTSYVGTW